MPTAAFCVPLKFACDAMLEAKYVDNKIRY
jgi:hypothetical protein